MGCEQYLCNRKRRKALFFGPCLKKSRAGFARALPSCYARDLHGRFLLANFAVPSLFRERAWHIDIMRRDE